MVCNKRSAIVRYFPQSGIAQPAIASVRQGKADKLAMAAIASIGGAEEIDQELVEQIPPFDLRPMPGVGENMGIAVPDKP